jgi:ABC-type lipoprotein export system ATPase subunit
MNKAPVLELQQVHKLYQGRPPVHVLKGVDLALFPGELVGIVGVSGSGKSTLLNILGLLDGPTQGRLYIQGRDATGIAGDAAAAMRRRLFGFVFQDACLLPEFTLWENLIIPIHLAGRSPRADELAWARQLLHDLGLGELADRKPSEASGGERQRAALARALVGRPRILLADEPTGSLDEGSSHLLFSLLRESVEEEKMGAVVATHDVELARQYCHRLLSLSGGKLAGS